MTANPFIFFFKCVFLAPTGAIRERMAVYDLFNKFSYRYNENESKSLLNAIRYLRTALGLLLKSDKFEKHSGSDLFVFDEKPEFYESSYEYISQVGIKDPVFIFRHYPANELGFFTKLYNAILLVFLFCFIFPYSLFVKDKAKPSIILLELTEALLLKSLLKKYGAKSLLIISAFEKDIVFLSYFLQRQRIEVILVPSSNPITYYYKNVICDVFVFTASFQMKEYEHLKNNWYVEKMELWPLYGFNEIKLNRGAEPADLKYKIGLLSSGTALRETLKHTNSTDNKDTLAERDLLHALKKFLDRHKLFRLIVFLHPLEKADGHNIQFSKKYYQDMFGGAVEFAPLDMASRKCFDLCSLSVSGFSSSQIERLFGGYKTLFAPMGYLENYFNDPRLSAISAQNEVDLEKLILGAVEMDSEVFFEKYDLRDYRWDTFTDDKNLNDYRKAAIA